MVQSLKAKIRAIPDFSRPGIVFRDITPLVADPAALTLAVGELIPPLKDDNIDAGRHEGSGIHLRQPRRVRAWRRLRAAEKAGEAPL